MQFTITNKILTAVVKLETETAYLSKIDFTNSLKDEYKINEKTLSAFYISNLLGQHTTVKEIEKLLEGKRPANEDVKSVIIYNWKLVMDFNRSAMLSSYNEIDKALLLQLNKGLMQGWKPSWDVKFKESGELGDSDFSVFGNTPKELNTADWQALMDWYLLEGNKNHPFIRISLILLKLISLSPLLYINDLTALAWLDSMCVKLGYSAKWYYPVIGFINSSRQQFADLMQLSEKSLDYTAWLEEFLTAWAKNLSEFRINLEQQISSEKEKNAKQPFLNLNQRQLKILRYLQTIPTLQREDYCKMMDVSTMTAYRDLNELLEKKLLKVDGQGRGTKYMLVIR